MAKIDLKELNPTKNDWVGEGDIYFPCNGKVAVTDDIKPGIYRVVPSPKPMDNRIGIRYVSPSFDLGIDKIYSTGGEEIQEVIKRTWDDERFQKKGLNLCTILSGIKGTGKTITAKQICNHYASRYPVFIVDNAFQGGIIDFIQSLDFKCVIFLDEAEKTFTGDQKTSLLKICDGAMNMSPKIILMTMNNLYVDPNLISRPGRVRYIKKFGNLPESTCLQILNDSLENKENIPEIMGFLSLLDTITIDIVQSIIEEINIYGNMKTVKKYMNIDKASVDTEIIVISPKFTEDQQITFMNFVNSRIKEGTAARYALNGSLSREDRKNIGEDFSDLMKTWKCEEPYTFVNKELIITSKVGCLEFVKYEPGILIPGFGRIKEAVGENWYKVEVDISGATGDDGDYCEDDECYDACYDDESNLLWVLNKLENGGATIKTGDELLVYLKPNPPMSIYRYGLTY